MELFSFASEHCSLCESNICMHHRLVFTLCTTLLGKENKFVWHTYLNETLFLYFRILTLFLLYKMVYKIFHWFLLHFSIFLSQNIHLADFNLHGTPARDMLICYNKNSAHLVYFNIDGQFLILSVGKRNKNELIFVRLLFCSLILLYIIFIFVGIPSILKHAHTWNVRFTSTNSVSSYFELLQEISLNIYFYFSKSTVRVIRF